MKTADYKKYRLGKMLGFAKFCVTLGALAALVVLAPSQATQFASYVGIFLLGASRAKAAIGL